MNTAINTVIFVLFFFFSAAAHAAEAPPQPDIGMLDKALIDGIRGWANTPVVHLTLEERNRKNATLDQAKIDALDKQWRAEREKSEQPLITAVLSSPLSGYLTRIQANSLGLYSELFVIDAKGLNAGQSAVTSDYWQGDEAKWQKTFPVGADAVFIDKPEFHKETGTWRAQINLTLAKAGQAIGAITVEVNMTELERRRVLKTAQN
jgi:hypothetical protein